MPLLVAGAAALATCRAVPDRPVVGVALQSDFARPIAALAEEALAREGIPVRVVGDTLVTTAPDAASAIARARRMSELRGVVGVVGHGGSRPSLAAAVVYNERHIPQVVPTATSRRLAEAGPWTFMLAPNDSVEGAFIARFAVEHLHAARPALFFVDNEYGDGLRSGIVGAMAARGVMVPEQVPFALGGDVRVLVEALLARYRPDVLLIVGDQREAGDLARAAFARLPGLRVIVGDNASPTGTLVEHAGPAADSLYGVSFWIPDSADVHQQRFIARFRELTGRDPQVSDALAYDAVMVLGRAAGATGGAPDAMRQ